MEKKQGCSTSFDSNAGFLEESLNLSSFKISPNTCSTGKTCKDLLVTVAIARKNVDYIYAKS